MFPCGVFSRIGVIIWNRQYGMLSKRLANGLLGFIFNRQALGLRTVALT